MLVVVPFCPEGKGGSSDSGNIAFTGHGPQQHVSASGLQSCRVKQRSPETGFRAGYEGCDGDLKHSTQIQSLFALSRAVKNRKCPA